MAERQWRAQGDTFCEAPMLLTLRSKGAEMAPEGCLFAHPPSARTRAVWRTAAGLTAPRHCKLPLEMSLYKYSPSPHRRQGSKVQRRRRHRSRSRRIHRIVRIADGTTRAQYKRLCLTSKRELARKAPQKKMD